MLEIAIIADDLTGANDTGVQLARRGLRTSVLISLEQPEAAGLHLDAIVMDTDSRAIDPQDAYRQVKAAAQNAERLGCKIIYKKMDSTLRGNIGSELDAVYDAVKPDFIVIAPAFPQNGRIVRDGILYVNGKPVHETDAGIDPKTPVKESHIPTLLGLQTEREVGLIDHNDISRGINHMQQKLTSLLNRQISFILFDSASEADLQSVADCIGQGGYHVVWAGSAGLANCLPVSGGHGPGPQVEGGEAAEQAGHLPVMVVIGSVNGQSRRQLDELLKYHPITAVKLQSHYAVEGGTAASAELSRICGEAEQALLKGQDVVLFSSGDKEDINKANEAGRRSGLTDPTLVSRRIAGTLGEAAAYLMNRCPLQGVVLTGGDTAKEVCLHWGATRFELIDEVESGIPRGRLIGGKPAVYAVTKAGGFGSEQVLIRAIGRLRKEDSTTV